MIFHHEDGHAFSLVDEGFERVSQGATAADSGTGKVGHLHHAVDEDQTLVDVLDLPRGHSAWRAAPAGPWTRQVGSPA